MAAFWNLKRIRALIGLRRQFGHYDEIDTLADMHLDPDRPAERARLRISLLGFRAEAGGKTGFAALKVLRKENPVLVRFVCAYLAVLALASVATVVALAPK
ncbi:hypothetical protein EES41_23115 [Streptomyces sp. ADI95-16]|uniref:hypothetical protein n=1 Tax=Streptomyces sp. ADI95-16 TaxID=1522758 RepID=UPI000F3A8F4C|nr:hypothetical protein [Streptomyces sp. ADI95-16]AYV29609.1 hypothetical protein EES41_23115 [Streptomyces sp. ADI95-16]